mmetsp:Transcript_147062/g.382246  ORF Transcript_147062/g.382246 Transcript_147062/m.382246 type:complete len:1151 (-) Transcript_147062:348-3800(-)|eukprot:CAMPEP_0115409110 /NCGR_PEP_ID=MMETSP0271-20121206/19838_1 /TAXON_ID=71861 /ORGANISM="Scrippsiella trochoidea, Strain CCMP3099" /LENGTH=1150 /DNA_ID=CAMNT_0002833253 /DNA_START=65 /DNA_END=3517 /DNA_ORIENTATION=-
MAHPVVNDAMVEEDVLGGCPFKGQPLSHGKESAMSAPSLPHLPDSQISCGFLPFTRTYSGGSTVVPDSAPETPFMSFQTDPCNESSCQLFGSFSFDPNLGLAFSRTISSESSMVGEGAYDACAPNCVLEEKLDQLEGLLGEVKVLYNTKYPLDHVDVLGHEVGCDVDGLAWVKYTGQGRTQLDRLQDLLWDVKDVYNARYPLDHVDVIGQEIGFDADGMLWVETAGQGFQRGQIEELAHLLEEVMGLYNQKYPLDHVDDAGCEVGYDTDGLLWMKYEGQGVHTQDAKVERLQHLLDEVKELYNGRYPLDSVDEVEVEVGTDADGLLWVQYSGNGVEVRDTQVGDLEELLEEVKWLYNEEYPLDHVDDVGQEVGRDTDGLLWVRYTGQGLETQSAKVEQLEAMLNAIKALYNERYPLDHADDADREVGCDSDGLVWIRYTGNRAEASELKMEELFTLLEEVKGLYNEKYLLDHVDDVSYEVGCDADGLLWVQHYGQSVERQHGNGDMLQDLLQEVKILYNQKYPDDHVDDDNCEVGRDADGLLWVQYTGQGAESREAKLDELLDLMQEVRTLYNEKFPLDHVDDMGCEKGYDADGLLWVQHIGKSEQTRNAKIAELDDLLEAVKALYNQKYPHDHVDDVGHEVGFDADGLLWVKYIGHSRVDDLQDLLEEVKGLYNEKYPLDHVDDMDREVGSDSDGLVWTKYTGQCIERSQTDRLGDLLQDVKYLYNERYPEDSVDDVSRELGCDADGMRWVKFNGQGIERSEVAKLEDLLAEVRDLYNKRYPHDHVDDLDRGIGFDVDGFLWVEHTGQGPKTWDAKLEKLEDVLQEVKDAYNEKYPQDHVDNEDSEVGTDADGMLWVRYMGCAAETREQRVEKLEDLLHDVRSLYNQAYPNDHVDDAGHEVGIDADGLLWVQCTGQSAETRKQKMDELQDLLAEVRKLYCEKYPLDHVDDLGHEVGTDADGLHWVALTGQGTDTREHHVGDLEGLLEEVRGLYNEKFPLDHVDDEETDVGHDSDGLLWVRHTGSGGRSAKHMQHLEDLLEEVKCLYREKYPLDYLDDEGRELGHDTDGLFWVEHSGLGPTVFPGLEAETESNQVQKLHGLLSEVRCLYNEKYPFDSIDDLGFETGYDAEGLLWVRHIGLGPASSIEMAA